MSNIVKLLKTPKLLTWERFRLKMLLTFPYLYSDRKFLEEKFRLLMGYELDLDNPRSFSEKLQWLKLNDKRPEYTQMVDKVEAKKYVSSTAIF